MNNIWLITWNTIRGLLAKKTMYFLFILVIIVLVSVGVNLYKLVIQTSDDPQILQGIQIAVVQGILSTWIYFSILLAIIYAAGLISGELKSRSILGTLAKPIARWEFLLGKWLGVQFFFYAILLIGIIICLILMLVWGIPFTGIFAIGILYAIVSIFVFSGISFVLSIYIIPVVGGGISFVIWTFGPQFESLLNVPIVFLKGLGYFLYYISPTFISQDLIKTGLLNNLIDPNFGFYWSVLAENFLYGAVLFIICIYFYQKRDIVLG